MTKLVGKGGTRFLFMEKKPDPSQQQPDQSAPEEVAHESVTEDDTATEDPASGLSEDDPVERETTQKMRLEERIGSDTRGTNAPLLSNSFFERFRFLNILS